MNYKKDNLLNERCLRGLHPLIEIACIPTGFEDRVIRWCPECGAIVIDCDLDGRTYPGRDMKMKLTKLYLDTRKNEGFD